MSDIWIEIYKLQYERIAQHENERMRFSSVVIVVTSAVLAYLTKLDPVIIQDGSLTFVIGLLLITINFTAIQFISKSRYWVKYHQKRAKALLESNSPENLNILYNVDKKNSDEDVFKRPNLQKNLHLVIILITTIHMVFSIYKNAVSFF